MTKFTDLLCGDIVSFVYHAGSNPGTERRVKLDTIDHASYRFAGEDLSLPMDEDGRYPYRQFRYEHIDENTLEICDSVAPSPAKLSPLKGERISFVDVHGEIADRHS
jgi:hypothetical protein